MVAALLHGVVEAGASGSVVTASDDAGVLEPGPWGADLTTVAAEGEAFGAVAAGSGVGDGEEGGVGAASGDADTVVESLGGSVSPAGAAVRLVTHVVDDGLALGPVGPGIEVLRVVIGDESWLVTGAHVDGPVGVNNGAHEALNFLKGSTLELLVDAGNPSGLRVRVDVIDVAGKVNGPLVSEEIHDVTGGAELEVDAGLLRLAEVNELGLVTEAVDELLELGESLVELVELLILSSGGVLNHTVAELADEVGLGVEVMGTASVGEGSNSSESEGAHLNFI